MAGAGGVQAWRGGEAERTHGDSRMASWVHYVFLVGVLIVRTYPDY